MTTRHYGLEIGNKIKYGGRKIYEVVEFSATDNNRCFAKDKDGKIHSLVCEVCEVVK